MQNSFPLSSKASSFVKPPQPSKPPQEKPPQEKRWPTFDIDRHIAPAWTRKSRLHHLPRALSHLLGHRPHPLPHYTPDVLVWLWSMVGVFLGILAVSGVGRLFHRDWFVVGSMGAAAILLFTTPLSPLAQPRNVVISQVFGAVIGVGLGKALPGREDWAAAVAVAVVAFLMLVTKTVHPPAGATAVLAVLDGNWDFVGLVMVSTVVMVVVALVWVNLGGLVVGMRWPLWWWVEGEAVNKEVVVDEVVVDEVVVVTSEGVKVPEWMELGESERRVLQAVWERIVERSGKEGGVQLEEV